MFDDIVRSMIKKPGLVIDSAVLLRYALMRFEFMMILRAQYNNKT